jgi:hypothetical protein
MGPHVEFALGPCNSMNRPCTVHGTVATADSLSMCRDLAHADQIFFLTNTVLAPAVHGQKIQAAVRSYK